MHDVHHCTMGLQNLPSGFSPFLKLIFLLMIRLCFNRSSDGECKSPPRCLGSLRFLSAPITLGSCFCQHLCVVHLSEPLTCVVPFYSDLDGLESFSTRRIEALMFLWSICHLLNTLSRESTRMFSGGVRYKVLSRMSCVGLTGNS